MPNLADQDPNKFLAEDSATVVGSIDEQQWLQCLNFHWYTNPFHWCTRLHESFDAFVDLSPTELMHPVMPYFGWILAHRHFGKKAQHRSHLHGRNLADEDPNRFLAEDLATTVGSIEEQQWLQWLSFHWCTILFHCARLHKSFGAAAHLSPTKLMHPAVPYFGWVLAQQNFGRESRHRNHQVPNLADEDPNRLLVEDSQTVA
jgi:hypothetical protein